MNLTEALKILQAHRAASAQRPARVALACGFTPLHLSTLLAAHLQERHPERRVEIVTGTYGDVPGNLAAIGREDVEGAAAVFEWADFDPRLGVRDLGGWAPAQAEDIAAHAGSRADQYVSLLQAAAGRVPVAVCLPTLPLPPLAPTAGWRQSDLAVVLSQVVTGMAQRLHTLRSVRIVASQYLDLHSPLAERLDVKAYLSTGFPYRLGHASMLAEALARLLCNAPPKKGVVTDLDFTLWRGILGEDGVDGVSWDLEHKSHSHGLYQQMLQSLADAGVLIAAASKTEPDLVRAALQSRDLLVRAGSIFPIEAHWEPKSVSVGRILAAWNVGPESIVFVDDSELELAEVKAAYAEVECLLFPSADDNAVYALLHRLRDLFGKESVSAEDTLRLQSIRAAAGQRAALGESRGRQDAFLAQAGQELTLSALANPPDPRALELINKTNQFNLNGRRRSEAEWSAFLESADALALLVAYRDKYGSLGKISVCAGRVEGKTFHMDTWVLSCRAFTRRIEYGCLEYLFQRYGFTDVVFDFQPTARNKLVREMLAGLTGAEPTDAVHLCGSAFSARRPALSLTYTEVR